MYLKNNLSCLLKSYLLRFLLIFIGLTLCNISCQKTTESQIRNVAAETVKEEEADMGNPDNAKEDFTYPDIPNYAVWEKKNPPRITIEVMTDMKKKLLTLTYSVKNTTGEAIWLFIDDPPLICLAPEQRLAFMNMIPIIPTRVYTNYQYYPPIVRLETNQIITRKASYDLPLYDKHPYGGSRDMFFPIKKGAIGTEVGTDTKERIKNTISLEEQTRKRRSMIKEDVSREALMYIGYFPEKDIKKGLRPGGNIDENIAFNGFRRQLLVRSNTIRLIIPVRLHPWMVELKTYWRK